MEEAVQSTISGYFVGWFTLAMLIAGIAQGKNRSGLGWFLLGFLFGPLALFILLTMEKIHEDEHRSSAD